MSKSNTPKWIFGSLTVVLVIAALFMVAEILARITGHGPYRVQGPKIEIEPEGHFFEKDKILGYKNKPGKFRITQNENLVFSTTHDPNGRRISSLKIHDSLPECWIFGCSFTYGWGVNNWECFPWLVQESMPQLNVTNFGVGGYGNFQNLLEFEQELKTGNVPACVVLVYAPFHDERNVMSKNFTGVLARFNKLGLLSMPYAQIDNNGDLIRESASALHYNTWPLAELSAFINAIQRYWIAAQDRELNGPQVSMAILNEFKANCEANNTSFILAYIGAPEKFTEISTQCRNTGIFVIDLSVDLSQEWASLLPLDPHPSPEAHRFYADRVIDALQKTPISYSLPKSR